MRKNLQFSERLEIALKNRGLRRSHLAKMLNLSSGVMTYYSQGRVPEAEILHKIARTLEVRAEWLLTGECPMECREVLEPKEFTGPHVERANELFKRFRDMGLLKTRGSIRIPAKKTEKTEPEMPLEVAEKEGRRYRRAGANQAISIEATPLISMLCFLCELWENANAKEQAWLEIQFLKCFPEWLEWRQRQEEGQQENGTASGAGCNQESA